jgi:E3 ubiquitin-protein ligase HERC2
MKKLQGKYENWKQNNVDARALTCVFEGEDGRDAGGLFRELLTNFVAELESGVLPLIMKTANQKSEHGEYRNCFMVNFDSKTPTHQEMFKFLGVLIGFAFRTGSCMPFNFIPSFWK